MVRPYRFCPLSRRSLYLFTRHLTAALSLFFSLSTHATAPVGATPGSFAVSPSGGATYTIPIALPPGTNGMAPSLSLNYNSQGGNGLLGMGWSIGGLSVIHRCGSTIALDGIKGGVNYDANDKFCLDGERLISIGGNEYRTQHESWQKIIAWVPSGSPAPSSFTVWSKDGTIREYGATNDSRIVAVGQSNVRLWALNKIEDRNGNYLTIGYNNNPTDYTPAFIRYTGNAAAGLSPYNSVNFEYGPRTDFISWYEGGAIVQTTQRLTRITTNAGASLMRAYNLGYDDKGAVGRSRLTSVEECGTDGVCLPATSFTWQDGGTGYTSATWTSQAYNPGAIHFGELNGDGKADSVVLGAQPGLFAQYYVSYSTGTGYSNGAWNPYSATSTTQSWLAGPYYGDVNGDGIDDFTLEGVRGVRNGDLVMSCYPMVLSNGAFAHVNQDCGWYAWPSPLNSGRFADVNGDGMMDFVAKFLAGVHYVSLSTGTGFTNLSWNGHGLSDSGAHFADVNGDGKTDYVTVAGSGVHYVSLSTGSGYVNQTWAGQPISNSGMQFADVNGDGKTDAITVSSTGVHYVSLSTGTGYANQQWTGQPLSDSGVRFADVNGDGKADAITVSNTGAHYVSLSTGLGYVNQTWSGQGLSGSGAHFADLNGDGKADYVTASAGGTHYVSLSNGPFPDLLISVVNGLGAQTTVSYKPLTDNTVYTKDTTAAYPYQDVQNATYVVSQSTHSTGIGGPNTTAYRYTGLKKHHTADASLGFRQIQTTDPAGLIHRTTSNQILDGTEGTVASSETWSGSVRVKQTSNTWTPVALGNGRTLAQLTTTQEQATDLNGAAFPTSTTTYGYDTYGNALSVITDHSDGHKKTTANAYNNDVNNWLLGQLTQSQVTAEATGQAAQTRTSAFTYDGLNRLVTEVIEPNSTTLQLTTTYIYSVFGNRIKTTLSGPGIVTRATSQTYDARGQFITSKTNALSHTESYENTPVTGALIKHTDINRLPTSWQYDGLGRKEKETRPDGSTTTHLYGTWALPGTAVRTDVSGAGTNYTYSDILGRAVQTDRQGLNNRIYQYTVYDNLGRVTITSHPYFTGETSHATTYLYDALGRALSATTVPGNRVTATAYNGLTVTVTNPKNQTLTTVKNSQGQVISATDAAGTTTYQHDSFGNLTQVTDVAGNITRMTYDLRGRKLSMHDPDMGNWSYSYNTLGELITQTDAKIQTTTMTYDLLGRMRGRLLPNNEGTATWTYGSVIPEIGKLKSLSNPNASETYVYDSLSRPTQVTTTIGGTTHTQTTTYDTLSRVDTLTYPGTGPKIKNVYAYGFLTQVTNANTGTVYWSANTADAHSRLTLETLGNGLTTTHGYHHETGDLSYIRTGVNFGVQNLSYQFDEIGNLKQRSDSNQGPIENFIYDNLNRLITVSGPSPKSYQYDTLGNITYKSDVGSYTYPPSGINSIRPHAVVSVAGDPSPKNYSKSPDGSR